MKILALLKMSIYFFFLNYPLITRGMWNVEVKKIIKIISHTNARDIISLHSLFENSFFRNFINDHIKSESI